MIAPKIAIFRRRIKFISIYLLMRDALGLMPASSVSVMRGASSAWPFTAPPYSADAASMPFFVMVIPLSPMVM